MVGTGMHAGTQPLVEPGDKLTINALGDEISVAWYFTEETDAVAF